MKRPESELAKLVQHELREYTRSLGFVGALPWLRRERELAVDWLYVHAAGEDIYAYLMCARHPAPKKPAEAKLLGSTAFAPGMPPHVSRRDAKAKGAAAEKVVTAFVAQVGRMIRAGERLTKAWPTARSAMAPASAVDVLQRFADACAKDLRLAKRTVTKVSLKESVLTIHCKETPPFKSRACAIQSLVRGLWAKHPRISDIVEGFRLDVGNRVELALLCGKLESACEDLAAWLERQGDRREARMCLVRAGIADDKVKTELGRRLFRKIPKPILLMNSRSSMSALLLQLLRTFDSRDACERVIAAASIVTILDSPTDAWRSPLGAREKKLLAELGDGVSKLAADTEPALRDLGKVIGAGVACLIRYSKKKRV